MFSALAQRFSAEKNALYRAHADPAHPPLNWVDGNVTRHGIRFPEDRLAEALTAGARQTGVYAPDPLGQRAARDAISRWYAAQGATVPVDQLILTPGTSLAYAYIFHLLMNPGEPAEILCPQPNYGLIDQLAELSSARVTHYPLREEAGWRIDLAALERAITPRTRAIVLISPHNPTGMMATGEELDRIAALAEATNVPLVVDEVFSPFVFQGPYPRRLSSTGPLILTLNGFSKALALPGIKIAWIAVTGAPALVATALRGLDGISDLFLPVGEPTQAAVPALLDTPDFQRAYAATMAERAAALQSALAAIPGLTWTPPAGGFYTTIRLPAGCDEEKVAIDLLKKENVLAHPGYFYDLEGQHLVISHVGTPEWTRQAAEKLRRVCQRR